MPRFEARSHAELKSLLSALGLAVAFTEDADFAGITGARGPSLQAVLHEAVVKTDEDGTEAAAATVVLGGVTGASPEFIQVNRPFLYLVRERASGALLFMGRVASP